MISGRSSLEPSTVATSGHPEDFGLDLSGFTDQAIADLATRFATGTIDALTQTAASVGYCHRPVRMVGSSTTVDRATGEVLSTYRSKDAPLGVTYLPCGNRRASHCPSCSRLYAADTFHLLRAGVAGGKTVPEAVRENPLVFVTLTAPSFGAVHRAVSSGACRAAARRPRCPHGVSMCCQAEHADDGRAGSPLCAVCYDYTTHIVWQWFAPELWRRFVIRLRRRLAARLGVTESRLGSVATVQYAKVAEYQTRGAVHFHGLVRLDGPRTDEGFAPAPVGLSAADLAEELRGAVAEVSCTAPPIDEGYPGHVLRFGRQVDVRIVRAERRPDQPDGPLTAEQVAGYLAKYATKSIGDSLSGGPTAHYRRLRDEAQRIGRLARDRAEVVRSTGAVDADKEAVPYERLGRWVWELGFRGHFSTKSRRYSVTLGALRRARRRWQSLAVESRRTGRPIDTDDLERRLLADEKETTLVVGSWMYSGTGWITEGDTALAVAAAARAREYAAARAARSLPVERNLP